ncbi:hypothetical protein FUA48_00270 [Flavobacterium alkalisoli]|uniref:Uncharacterized protein n=1 Tax=Flavobacterium alkalisoli TaxID=2602769 RepID=A0A5B9FTH4_9FLAO|nr:hypothetical protein [Flavobacterium alkalisoli]QEE48067.1 hypothetical protein FUA48_00270 [Flavobacterium alkalisoli]
MMFNDAAATVNLIDNNDGSVTLVKADGTQVAVGQGRLTANGTVPIPLPQRRIDVDHRYQRTDHYRTERVYTFTAADGSVIDTIDTNASALAYDNTASGLTAGTVQAALDEVVTALDDVNDAAATVNLIDNNDGSVTLVKADGTQVAVAKADITANGDGTYTFTNNDGSDVTIDTNGLTITELNGVYTFTAADGSVIDTIDTNASALAYDNTASGLTAGTVQAALDEVVTALDDVNDAAATVNLIDNNDGSVTLVKADGTQVAVAKADITANGDGTYTFTTTTDRM